MSGNRLVLSVSFDLDGRNTRLAFPNAVLQQKHVGLLRKFRLVRINFPRSFKGALRRRQTRQQQ